MTITAVSGVGGDRDSISASKKRLNERFHGHLGRGVGGGSLASRLGERIVERAPTDSRDSLERDTGEDLKGELAEGNAANMLIQVRSKAGCLLWVWHKVLKSRRRLHTISSQVTQSDEEMEEEEQQETLVKEERKVRRTEDTSPSPTAYRVKSQVKVKVEKEDDDSFFRYTATCSHTFRFA